MERWYRVFGSTSDQPHPEALLAQLLGAGLDVEGHFRSDAAGWAQAELVFPDATILRIDRYLADEEGLRAELNSWAAWVEAHGDDPEHVRLMERLIQTKQLLLFESAVDCDAAETVCRLLARATEGIYQIDDRGIFQADGTRWIAE